ncbi:AMP-binding protein [Streptomyces sp. NPDC056411]|uniref:AMP-binding protein n=1 Tax=Streptomyces sp. NPDC056411 TaxID=3345813 RepID=UPI0035E07F99
MPVAQRVARSGAGPRRDEPAFTLDDQVLTYRQLALHAAAVAAGLRTVRPLRRPWLPPGAPLLALGTGNHPVFAELFAGASAGDGAVAVLDPQWGAEQAGAVLDRLRPDLLVLPAGRTALHRAADRLGLRTLRADAGADADAYEAWRARYLGAAPAEHLRAGGDDTPFLIGFTSGSTGLPHAFHRSRGSWRISLAEGRKVWGMDAEAHTLAPGPLAHGLSLYALAECLESGAAFHGLRRFDAASVLRHLERGAVRRLIVVPTMLSALCAAAAGRGAPGRRFASVETVVSGGAKLSPQLIAPVAELLPQARVREYYGASELGFVTVGSPGPDTPAQDVGTAFPSVTLEIRDTAGRPAPLGTPGTVFVRSPLVSDGYVWGEGSFRTVGDWATVGDTGRLTADGHLHLLGRGGMVISGGLNVYPSEVEDALTRLAPIDTALVTAVPDDHLGQALVAVVSGTGPDHLGHTALRDLCATVLPRYQVPRRFYTLDAWPLTSSGKIARGRIEEWIARGDSRLRALPEEPHG